MNNVPVCNEYLQLAGWKRSGDKLSDRTEQSGVKTNFVRDMTPGPEAPLTRAPEICWVLEGQRSLLPPPIQIQTEAAHNETPESSPGVCINAPKGL